MLRADGVVAARGEHGVATREAVLFKKENGGAGTLGGDRCVEARAARADHHDVIGFARLGLHCRLDGRFVGGDLRCGFGRIGERHLVREGVAVVADELRTGVRGVAARAVDVAEMRVVRIDLRARLPDVLIGAVAGLALRVERTLVVGDGRRRHRVRAVARGAAAHLRVKVRERLARRRFAADEGAAQKRADHQAECLLRQHDVFSF